MSERRSVIIIGNFDGVHQGHQYLIRQAKNVAKRFHCEVLALTFWPHPKVILDASKQYLSLSHYFQRKNWLHQTGVDHVLYVSVYQEMLRWSPAEFIDRVLQPLNPYALCISPHFHFGYKRQGNIKDLQKVFDVIPVDLVEDPNHIVYSSSKIRSFISEGNMEQAHQYLTRPFTIRGFIRSGAKVGKKIGSPTINVDMGQYQRPKPGVYTVTIHIPSYPNVTKYHGVANIGHAPTFEGRPCVCEVYVLDDNFSNHLVYGIMVQVECHHFIRSEKKFDSIQDLQQAIHEDIHTAKMVFKTYSPK